MFIYAPGKYCIYVLNNQELQLPDLCDKSFYRSGKKYESCSIEKECPFRYDHRSFDYAQGRFDGYKVFRIDKIGYYEFDIPFKPKTYFLLSNTWDDLTYLLAVVLLLVFSFVSRKIYKRKIL